MLIVGPCSFCAEGNSNAKIDKDIKVEMLVIFSLRSVCVKYIIESAPHQSLVFGTNIIGS